MYIYVVLYNKSNIKSSKNNQINLAYERDNYGK